MKSAHFSIKLELIVDGTYEGIQMLYSGVVYLTVDGK